MNRHKKHWYIWFSILAFILLWSDTTKRLKFSRENIKRWHRSLKNALKLWCFYVMLIPISFAVLMDRLFLRSVPNESIHYEIMIVVVLVLIYLGGVRATYRHSVWRKENIADLIAGIEQKADDENICDEATD